MNANDNKQNLQEQDRQSAAQQRATSAEERQQAPVRLPERSSANDRGRRGEWETEPFLDDGPATMPPGRAGQSRDDF